MYKILTGRRGTRMKWRGQVLGEKGFCGLMTDLKTAHRLFFALSPSPYSIDTTHNYPTIKGRNIKGDKLRVRRKKGASIILKRDVAASARASSYPQYISSSSSRQFQTFFFGIAEKSGKHQAEDIYQQQPM